MTRINLSAIVFLALASTAALAQQPAPTTAATAPNADTSYIDAQGTAHVTRVVPIPDTISPEAKHALAVPYPDQDPPASLAQRRAGTDAYTAGARVQWTKICPNTIEETKIAGVSVRIVTPENISDQNKGQNPHRPPRRWVQLRLRFLHRVDSDCLLHKDQGRRRALPALTRESLSGSS